MIGKKGIRKYYRVSGISKIRYPVVQHLRYQPSRSQTLDMTNFNVHEECGMFEDDFEKLVEKVTPLITVSQRETGISSKTVLSPEVK